MRKRRIRPVTLILLIPALFLGVLGWSVYVQFRHDYLDRSLIAAIQSKQTDVALAWLARGADVNARSSATARSMSLLDWLKILVGRKARPKYDGPSALVLAVQNNETPIVQALLARGARDVNSRTQDGNPLLVVAARYRNPTIVNALLNRHADANARDQGETALMVAASNEDPASVRLLLDHGADVNARCGNRYTALVAAASVTCLEDQNLQKHQWQKVAKSPPVYKVLKLLLDYGADIDAQDFDGYTALYHIADLHDAKCEKLLLDRGANIEIKGRFGITALSSAVENGRTDLVRALLARGADPNQKHNRHDITVLMDAAANGDMEMVKLLLDRGAKVNEQDDGSFGTALVAAVMKHGPIKLVRLLLNHGASVNVRDIRERTALDWAQENNDTPAIALLKQYGAQGHSIRWLQEHD